MHLSAADDASLIAKIHRQYVEYLRQDRGLAENSVLVYAPFIRDFIASQDAGDGNLLPHAFDAIAIRNHVVVPLFEEQLDGRLQPDRTGLTAGGLTGCTS